MKWLTLFLLISFVTSCSFTKMKANKLLKKGNFDRARELYVQVLKNDPNDEEALSNKRIAERKIINRDLLKIRDQIGSGSFKGALSTSKKVLKNINEWNVETDPNAANFLNVRRKTLFPYYKKHVIFLLKDSKPKKAESFFKEYKIIFWDFSLVNLSKKVIEGLYNSFEKRINQNLKDNFPLKAELFFNKENDARFHSSMVTKLQFKIKRAGIKKCRDFKKDSRKKSFFNLFLKNYCDHFYGAKRSISSINDYSVSSQLFSSPIIFTDLEGVPNEISKEIEEYIDDVFKKSPWYHPDGKKKAVINLKGFFKKKLNIQTFQKNHSYTVLIPYTAMVPKLKSRQVPYSSTKFTCSYNYYTSQQTCMNLPVTKYKTEFYTVNVPVTRYRREKRFFSYMSKKYNQNFLITLNAEFKLDKNLESLNYSNSLSESDEFHDQNLPKIKLYKNPLEITRPLDWLKSNSQLASQKFFKNLKVVWERSFCFPKGKRRSTASIGESVVKCARSNSFHQFIKDWHKKNFDLDKDQVESIIGKYSK